jgi:hypothetical protein
MEKCFASILEIAKVELWAICPENPLCFCGPRKDIDEECVTLLEVRAFCPEVG